MVVGTIRTKINISRRRRRRRTKRWIGSSITVLHLCRFLVTLLLLLLGDGDGDNVVVDRFPTLPFVTGFSPLVPIRNHHHHHHRHRRRRCSSVPETPSHTETTTRCHRHRRHSLRHKTTTASRGPLGWLTLGLLTSDQPSLSLLGSQREDCFEDHISINPGRDDNHHPNHNHNLFHNQPTVSSHSPSICVSLPTSPSYQPIARAIADRLGVELCHSFSYGHHTHHTHHHTHTHNEDGMDEGTRECTNGSNERLFQHRIVIVPYTTRYSPILDTYAIALQTTNDKEREGGGKNKNKNNKKKKKKRKDYEGTSSSEHPYYVDFCPSKNTRMGRRLRNGGATTGNNTNGGGGSEALLKAIQFSQSSNHGTTKPNPKPPKPPKPKKPIVYDLTAGFGSDSLLMATSGNFHRVLMVERDPIVALLLEDGLRRLRLIADMDVSSMEEWKNTEGMEGMEKKEKKKEKEEMEEEIRMANRLVHTLLLCCGDGSTLCTTDGITNDTRDDNTSTITLTTTNTNNTIITDPSFSNTTTIPKPDVCYLDPMFPPRRKSALVKKPMKILHGLLQSQNPQEQKEKQTKEKQTKEKQEKQERTEESLTHHPKKRLQDEANLLRNALSLAKTRVVVKRPVHAPPLGYDGDGVGVMVSTTDEMGGGGGERRVRKPSYETKGSTNRFDVYVVSST